MLKFLGLVLLAAAARLIPHAPNFSPIIAIALFAGSMGGWRWSTLLIPVAAMLVSDLVIGFHDIVPEVYSAVLLIALLGVYTRANSWMSVTINSTAAAVLFFVTTNAGVWWFSAMYPHTVAGLTNCFVAAIPFFHNTLLSSWLFSGVLFGGARLMMRLGLVGKRQYARIEV